MASETELRPEHRLPQARAIRFAWWFPLAAIAAAVALFVAFNLVATSPRTIDRLTLVNGSGYNLEIDVTGARGGSLALGTAAARATTEFRTVIDQGSTWRVHFTAQGRDGGELRIERADLAAGNWRIAVPDRVVERLRAAGAPPSPTTDR